MNHSFLTVACTSSSKFICSLQKMSIVFVSKRFSTEMNCRNVEFQYFFLLSLGIWSLGKSSIHPFTSIPFHSYFILILSWRKKFKNGCIPLNYSCGVKTMSACKKIIIHFSKLLSRWSPAGKTKHMLHIHVRRAFPAPWNHGIIWMGRQIKDNPAPSSSSTESTPSLSFPLQTDLSWAQNVRPEGKATAGRRKIKMFCSLLQCNRFF